MADVHEKPYTTCKNYLVAKEKIRDLAVEDCEELQDHFHGTTMHGRQRMFSVVEVAEEKYIQQSRRTLRSPRIANELSPIFVRFVRVSLENKTLGPYC